MTEEALFELAVNVAEAERTALLDRECAGNPELRARIEALLRADGGTHAFDANGATGTFGPSTGSFHPTVGEAGQVIAGKYTLLEVVGEGGMGSVWRAKQTEPVKRHVAIKLIKAGMDSKAVLARFEAERQALAMMDHPNIAKILDGGLHENRPYFVMELVKGTPITEFCDKLKLTPQQRLELFVPVCQAIQHAHQKGIIHRDIKPSNVLIALYDDKPVPKVIDFGVAKATGGALTESTIDTGFGGIVGTPQYMSPEQATFNNLDIDTRSDVYSLGVLLYELLAGSPPFAKKELEKRGLLEILRVVREEEPPRPSTKLSTADALPSLSASRSTEPKKLTGLLRNELDWIVMKALEKDRSRRYETANGFAADVNRYLAGEAVQAHPPSTAYRVRKFVRRHKGQVIAASLVLFVLLAGVAGTTVGLIEAKKQEGIARTEAKAKDDALQAEAEERKKADAAKVEAQAKAAEANAVVQFLEDKVFAAARPKNQAGGLGKDVTLRDAIAASLPALTKSFADQALVEARLRMTLGRTFSYLGDNKAAAEQCERARAIFTDRHGPDHPDTLLSMHYLAISYFVLGRHDDAIKLREEVLAARRRILPPDHPDTLASMGDLAILYYIRGRYADAIKLQEEVLAARRRVFLPDHADTLASMSLLALSYAALGRHPDALKLREEVLAAQRRALPPGRHADDLELIEETLATQKRLLPPDHPDTLATMNVLALSYENLGRHADALKLYEETLAAQRRTFLPDHPGTLWSMTFLAGAYTKLGRHADALKLYEELRGVSKRVHTPDNPIALMSMQNLAGAYAKLGRHADALKLYEEILAVRKLVHPPDHTLTLMSVHFLAEAYVKLGRHADALKLIEETLADSKRVLPPDHPNTLMSVQFLAETYVKLGRHADALKSYLEILAANKRVFGPDHPDTLASMRAVAASLFKLNRGAEAILVIDECVARAAGKVVHARMIPGVIDLRLRHFQKTGDPAGCRATAEMWDKLNRTDAVSLYDAACWRAVTASVQAKTPGTDAARLAQDDADRAMQWLHKAVQAGYKDAAHMKKDTDLDPLRDREDFKKLLAELEAKKVEKK